MTQREVTEAQPVPRCARGHHARHMLDMRRQSAGGGHFIECRCCQTRKYGTYGDALREWRQKNGARAPKMRIRQEQQSLFPIQIRGLENVC